jgi:rod shape-determining protein MreC
MESSRDDFVIAIRSALLKKGAQQRFSLLGLIFFSIIFLVLGTFNFKGIDYVKIIINETVYRSSFIISIPENLVKKNYLFIKSHLKLYSKNLENKKELENLRSKSLTSFILVLENDKYKKLIDDYFIKDNEIYAKVLIDKNSPFLKSIILNKGSKHNIKLGMVVMDGIYLVGKVVEVNYLTSRVLLLPDINSKIPISLQPGDTQAIMSGNGNEKGILQYIKNKDIRKDVDELIILTSGAGELFKSGIPIGRIPKSELNSDEPIVSFYVNFSQLQYVKVVDFIKEKDVLDVTSKKELLLMNNRIEMFKKQKETLRILLEQKKISDEIRVKIEEENYNLRSKSTLLENELNRVKTKIKKINLQNEENKFKELEVMYGRKCKKTFYNKLYKIGTPEYENCILSKDKNN